ncbi:hypothetical protein [Streptomyces sp. XD-27]|uniref:hypothetical protein n=1 Tax=Streptomyces sp. XD-27 TaxID=3062779 RepID=UPI0026F46B9F|nr:hypothetical protein [Streptomyces sp. XD-27]WKX69861.1 hypothetical protein Q3Y56_08020 [Streptomyces sp. XD-27]
MAERDANEADARDDDAAFAEIVAAYGEEPADPPGVPPWPDAERVPRELPDDSAEPGDSPRSGPRGASSGPKGPDGDDAPEPPEKSEGPETSGASGGADPGGPSGVSGAGGTGGRPGGFIVYAPGVGPRDWQPAEASEDDFDETDEGHFVPPEPPPLPHADTTARFAWLAVLGGPLLLLLAVVFRWEMTWWLSTVGVGGFLGGFATLVVRMRDGDEDEDDDPGRGAVV